jgi:hypothetical protein
MGKEMKTEASYKYKLIFLSKLREYSSQTIRHVYGRIRLKYGNFRSGNDDGIQCTVLRFSYGIIRRRIRAVP